MILHFLCLENPNWNIQRSKSPESRKLSQQTVTELVAEESEIKFYKNTLYSYLETKF